MPRPNVRSPRYAERAYKSQAAQAKSRGIQFNLSFDEWMKIWIDSGKWDQRGTGRKYVMCRRGDTGPYEVGNVYIETGIHNSSVQGHRPRPNGVDLPTGVLSRNGKFVAVRWVKKKLVYIARFPDAASAEKAYWASYSIKDEALVAGDRSFLRRCQ